MGRAPPHMIFKRAVKHLMSQIIPGSLQEALEAEESLNQCWAVHGIGSSKCSEQLEKYNEMIELNRKYERFIETKRYKMHALRYLAPASRKCDLKGRHKEKFFNYPETRFRIRDIKIDDDSDK